MDIRKEKELQKLRQRQFFRYKQNEGHLHKVRRLSLGTYNLAVKEVEEFSKIISNEKKDGITTRMNAVERQWAKRRQRKRLHQTHRKLPDGWTFLNPIRKLLPRQVQIRNYKQDYLFYFCNILLLFACGLDFGMYDALLTYELILIKIGALNSQSIADLYKNLPMLSYASFHSAITVIIFCSTIVGIPAFYVGVIECHWAYFIIMVGANLLKMVIATILRLSDTCPQMGLIIEEKLTLLVKNYYYSEVAIDESKRKVLHPNGSDFYLRTHSHAFLMDKIQRRLGCCGSNSFRDYFLKQTGPGSNLWIPEVPHSCCTPVWNLNPYCAKEIPEDPIELTAKIYQEGCKIKLFRICENAHRSMSQLSINTVILQLSLFIICCIMMAYQTRQIRQLKRPTHFDIPWDAANKGLMVSESGQKQKLIDMLSLDPDEVDLPQELLDVINQFRQNLGLDRLGHKARYRPPPPPPPIKFMEVVELPFVPKVEPKPVRPKIKHNIKEAEIRSRLDVFELNSLQPYFKGLFSATYTQENQAAKNMVLNQMKANANQYYEKDYNPKPKKPPPPQKKVPGPGKVMTAYHWKNPHSTTKVDKKPTTLVVTNSRKVKANPQAKSETDK